MLEVQKLFKDCNQDLSIFVDELSKIGVDVRNYPEHGFMHLDYNMIECIKTHPIVIECRGLIMDYAGEVVCKSFDRFFNLSENGVVEFDFANSVVYEKADGSLCLEENTKIETSDGVKTIKEICDSKYMGKVKAYDHSTNTIIFSDVQGHLITENTNNWFTIETVDGTTLTATGDHKVWVTNKNSYVKVSDLTVDDFLKELE